MSHLQNFNYQILGRGSQKLVFLHGLLGSGVNWRKITPHFENDYQILIYDQRGHGRSFHPPVQNGMGYRPEDYAQDLHLIAQELGWSQFDLVGHSMGGRNAQSFAALHPEFVRALVIEDIGPEMVPAAAERIVRLLERVPSPFPDKLTARNFILNDLPPQLTDWADPMVISQFLYMNIKEKPDKTADWRFFKDGILSTVKTGRNVDRWAEYRSLSMPTLLIRGENSDEISRPLFDKMLAENPRVRGLQIAGAGHWVHNDQPEAFAKAVFAFFQEV